MPTVLPEPIEDKRATLNSYARLWWSAQAAFAHPADGIDDELRFLLYSLQRSADLQAQAVGQFAYAFDSALLMGNARTHPPPIDRCP